MHSSRSKLIFSFLLAIAAGIGVLIAIPHRGIGQTPTPPNIVFILTDDQRWDTMQYMPITQQLVQNAGVTFENYFISQSICCPSRSTILTGLYSHHHNVWSNVGGGALFKKLGLDQNDLGVWMSNAGYRTAMIGKYLNDWELTQPWPYRPPGWSVWQAHGVPGDKYVKMENDDDSIYYLPNVKDTTMDVANKSVDFILSTPANQPLFLYLAPTAPHLPAISPIQDYNLFANIPNWNPPSFNQTDVSKMPVEISSLPLLTSSQASDVQLDRKHQLASLLGVDRAVGRIVDALQASGRLNNTVIIYTSDNGLMWGEHRLQGKNRVYEESVRVPLIIKAPGMLPRVETKLTANFDMAATIADFAGITPPYATDGMSLKPLMLNSGAPWRSEVLLEVTRVHALRTDQYMYAEWKSGEKEFYDLTVDPYQMNNVASDPNYQIPAQTLSNRLASYNLYWPPDTPPGGGGAAPTDE